MPTKPLDTLLDRHLSIADAQVIIDMATPPLRECVNYGTHLLARCSGWSSETIEDMALPLLFRHILEVSDAIEVLLSNSCSNPTAPLLRSSFEAFLSIEYILQAHYEFRALAWIAEFYRKRITLYESYDPHTQMGQNLQEIMKSDQWTGGSAMLEANDEFKKFADNYRKQLQSKKFRLVQTQFERARKERYWPKWYRLSPDGNTGPTNLRLLAKEVSMLGFYEVLYRAWSSTQHAHDPSRFLTTAPQGYQTYRPLRDAHELASSADFAVHFILITMKLLVMKFRSEENEQFQKWYATEILAERKG